MTKEIKSPKLRFKGFINDWGQRKVGEIFTTITDYVANGSFKSLREHVKTYRQPNFAYMIRLIDASNKWQGPWLYTDKTGYDFLKKSSLHPNDILLSNVGAGVGKTFLVPKLDKPMTLAPNAILIKSNVYDNKFLFYLLNTHNNKKKILSLVGTGAQPKLNKTDLRELNLWISLSKSEQEKINKIISKVDRIIYLQQRKLDLLKKVKEGFLQNLFPIYGELKTRIRFKGFNNKWKKVKLGDISGFSKGSGINKKELHKEGRYPVIHYADLYKFSPVQPKVIHYINSRQGKLIPDNSLLFPGSDVTSTGLARTSTIKSKSVFAGGDVIICTVDQKIAISDFLSYEINLERHKIIPLITGTTVRHVHAKDLEKLTIKLPNLALQRKYALIFNHFERKIQLGEIKIKHLKQIKKFLLQNMFI